ncbi:MAG: UTP--glucose-1-phosphate uridylyltransferase [Planctomycetes bacterium]|nr:UTP--glucose-1-phosphate uridylyltransferase [Planctomycetota bacterium]
MTDLQSMQRTLAEHGQEHLLRFYEELPAPRQQALLKQLASIDFERLDEYIQRYVLSRPELEVPSEILPPPIFPARPTGREADEADAARKRGEQLLSEGKVAAFVVAGGQGTRLGFDGPKGCLEVTPVTHKPLFQVFAEQILAAARRYKVTIPWYVMTSPVNDVDSRAFFRRHNYFGLNPKDVFFLVQGMMPAVGLDGKCLLAEKDELAMSPDGHGGCLPALRVSGALEDMTRRGVEYISYFQVDNPLVHCIDPLFIGLHAMRGAEMSAKCLPKRDPMEKLGNFCVADGKVMIIEYSDMPEELARATTSDGRLLFGAGSIAIHVISRSFVERLTADGECSLPVHRAEKKVAYVDDDGRRVEPAEPNAVKLERFVFDALPLAEECVILETDRHEEFSPVKNADGEDSLTTCLHDQVRRAATWLEAAGIKVPRDADGQVAAAIEISPLFADSAEELAKKVDRGLSISTGQSVYLGSRGQTGGLR